jgi:hypothetical protein
LSSRARARSAPSAASAAKNLPLDAKRTEVRWPVLLRRRQWARHRTSGGAPARRRPPRRVPRVRTVRGRKKAEAAADLRGARRSPEPSSVPWRNWSKAEGTAGRGLLWLNMPLGALTAMQSD